MQKLTRRDCLGFAGGAFAASALAGCRNSLEAQPLQSAKPDAASGEDDWGYRPVDPTVAAQRVYSIYSGGG